MIPVHNFANQNSLVSVFINELRDINIQKDSMRFRRNVERIGEIIAYEISKQLEFTAIETETPLGIASGKIISEQPVLATILRAGLPLHQGMLNFFDRAENAFISAYRKHNKNDTFEIEIEYLSSPTIQNKTLILTDPMLATGSSMVLAYRAMLNRGIPKHTHIVSVIASTEGINYIKRNMPANTSIWVGAIDEELTAQAYIVPGLGDAGDLAYGAKI
jgi:uracil phosphoribosyltransferase